VADTTAALHELHLFFIDLHDGAVGVGRAVYADDKAVGQGADLVVVTDTRHGATLWYDVAEMVEKLKEFFFSDGVGVLFFNAGNFRCQASVHVTGIFLKQVAVRIFERILVDPDTGGQFITLEVIEGGSKGLVVCVRLFHVLNLYVG